MKLVVSSDGLFVCNAVKIKIFSIGKTATDYYIFADETIIAKYKTEEDAKKSLNSIVVSLTSSVSDVVLRMEDTN